MEKSFINQNLPRKALLALIGICLCVSSTLAQVIGISGTVTDQSGDPLPGVNVRLKKTTIGTVSDVNGKYSISVPNKDAVLVFSFVGFVTQELAVESKTVINVTLAEDIQQMEEVIVVAFGTATRETLTGAVSSVSARELDSRPVANTMQALQGLVPGLNIDITSGNMTSTPSLNVRGPGTIGTSPSRSSSSTSLGSPLVLIDGVEGDMNSISPSDIESVSVLKDAASSSIYGSKAAFGVILITTKRGKAGEKANVNYSYNVRFSSPIRMPEMMDSWTFMNYFNDASQNGGGGPVFNAEKMTNALQWQRGEMTANNTAGANGRWDEGFVSGWDNQDYFKVVYRDVATAQEHNVSANGGIGNLAYYTSFNYLQRDGFLKWQQDQNKRYATNVRLSYDLNKWVRINYNNRFTRNKLERPAYYDGDSGFFADMARQAWPNFPLYDENGYLWAWPALRLRDGGTAWRETDQNVQQIQVVVEPVKNWRTTVQYNYTTTDDTRKSYQAPAYTLYNKDGIPYPSSTGNNSTGYVRDDWEKINLSDFQAYSEYSFKLAEVHSIKAMAGMQAQNYLVRTNDLLRRGVQVTSLPVIDLTNGLATPTTATATPPEVHGAQNKWATMGFFGRINYDYQNRYLLEVNLRYDGTSRFRDGHRWTLSPSAALAWNIAREEFMKPLESVFTILKLRLSYGVLSNQNTRSYYPTYQDMTLGSANSGWLLNGVAVNTATGPTRLENPYMTWETIKTGNIGLDFGVLHNRLTGTLELFQRANEDMIGPSPVSPAVLGTSVPLTNNTSLKDTGFELTLGWRDRLQSGLTYGVRFNLQNSKTIITKFYNPTNALTFTTGGNGGENNPGTLNSYIEGRTTNEIWGLTTAGIAKTQDEMDAHLAKLTNGGQSAINGGAWRAGDVMYQDTNGDGKIDKGASTVSDHGDLSVIGNSTAQYRFGLDMNAAWKGFDVRVFLQGTLKRDYWINSYYFWGASSSGQWWSTGLKPHTDYFRDDPNHGLGVNLDSYYPRPYFNTGKNTEVQTGYVHNAAYVRIKNVQVGYTLPSSWTNKIMITNLRIYFSCDNLATFTKLNKLFDPEGISSTRGVNYPLSRVLSAGVSVNF